MELKVVSIEELERQMNDLSPAIKKTVWTDADIPGHLNEIKNVKALVNPNNGFIYDVVSSRYALIQHKDAFKPVVEALKLSGKTQVRGEFIQNKGRAWMSVVFPELTINDGSDGIEVGIQLKNAYESGMALKITSTRSYYEGRFLTVFGYRKVCSNGMMVRVPFEEAMRGVKIDEWRKEYVTEKELNLGELSTRVVHLGDEKKAIQKLNIIIQAIVNSIPYIQTLVDKARRDELTPETARGMLKHIGFGKRMVERVMKQYANDEQTRWGLYNAVTYNATHNAKTPMQTENQLLMVSRLLV